MRGSVKTLKRLKRYDDKGATTVNSGMAAGAKLHFQTFEDLEVYQAAREFRKATYSVSRRLPDDENLLWQSRSNELQCHSPTISLKHMDGTTTGIRFNLFFTREDRWRS